MEKLRSQNSETEAEREFSDESEEEEEDLGDPIELQSGSATEPSEGESYHTRLSCILEDDESEGSAGQGKAKEFPKGETPQSKVEERDKSWSVAESDGSGTSESPVAFREQYDPEKCRELLVTDLDDPSTENSDVDCSPSIKTLLRAKIDRKQEADEDARGEGSETEEEEEDAFRSRVPFGIKKLESSENVLEKRIVSKRTEFSSDSSDIDISISNEKWCDTVRRGPGDDDDETTTTRPSGVPPEEEEKGDDGFDGGGNRERSRAAPSPGEGAGGGSDSSGGSLEREVPSAIARSEGGADPKIVLQVVQVRSKSPRVYTPPVPPETYLWEELKRLRGKGGYPWTYLDKPPFDEVAWKRYMEHEYEPINPPPLSILRRREPADEKTSGMKNGSDVPETESRSARVTREDVQREKAREDAVAGAEEEESKTAEDMEVEDIAAAPDLREDEEQNRYPAQQSPATTTASRTDCDVNTSMLDSSGLEDVPLRRTHRSKAKNQALGIQQKLRNQAGKIRSKLRNMQRGGPVGRERQKGEEGPGRERRRLRFPERPRFSFPEKAKFSLPERPTFKLPESAKFGLPDRPKFSFPERPKLNLPELHLPERPKLRLPERPKFHLPQRPNLHLPERPKLHLPARPKFTLPEMSKFHLPDRPKLHLPERPKINLASFAKPLREKQGPASPKKNIFELDLGGYPKIFSRSRQRPEYATSSPKKARGNTPPPKMRSEPPTAPERRKIPVGQGLSNKLEDIKYADEEMSADAKDRSESMSDVREKELEGYMEDLDFNRFPPVGRRTLSTKSSLSRTSERDAESLASSEGRLRKGVLEEIDSDEFFLRQKGISQEDIDMGKYLSHEIREAFRSPEVNALARMDYDYYGADAENEPRRPTRTRSSRKSNLKKKFESDPALSESSGYKTYPPRRPQRKSSTSRSKSLVDEEAVIVENSPYRGDVPSELYVNSGSTAEYEHYKVPRPLAEAAPVPFGRKRSGKKKPEEEVGARVSAEETQEGVPQPLTRRKSKKHLEETGVAGGARLEKPRSVEEPETSWDADRVPEEAPVPPRRARSSSGSRSIRSSRSLRSEGVEEGREVTDSIEAHFERARAPEETQPPTRFSTCEPPACEATEEDPDFGYATIGKPTTTRPERQKRDKPLRPPPPRRKRETPRPFSTVPRRAPVRPIRNYSTLGPSRPPRKEKALPSERLIQAYIDIESESAARAPRYEECDDSSKNLQKDEVVEKMKGRPLPPPPRPPRLKSRGPDDFPEPEESDGTKESATPLAGPPPVLEEADASVRLPAGVEPSVEEVCASTQTDPLPDDFLLDVEDEVIQEFSHEQLKIQQAFLENLQKEANRVEEGSASSRKEEDEARIVVPEDDVRYREILEKELLAELEKEIIANGEKEKVGIPETLDVDLGYASLDRRQQKQERESSALAGTPEPIQVRAVPDAATNVNLLRTDKLDVKELEVEKLNVKEVTAEGVNIGGLQANQLRLERISAGSGNLTLGSIDLPDDFIRQLVDRIPWGELRQSAEAEPPRRALPPESSEESPCRSQQPRRHRRHRREKSSGEEDGRPSRRQPARAHEQTVSELSGKLAVACAASGVRAMRSIASRVQASRSDGALLLRGVLCLIVIAIAAFLLLGCDRQTIVHHHWDFQFPPQPPPRLL